MTGCMSFEALCSLFARSLLDKGQAFAGDELNKFQRSRLAEAMTADIRKLGDMVFPAARTPKVSAAANQIAESMGFDLRQETWHSQKKIDGYKVFTYEHLHPVREIRLAISRASSVDRVIEILDRMLWVAWITKEEDQRLHRKGFGSIRPDPFKAYKDAGIALLPDDPESGGAVAPVPDDSLLYSDMVFRRPAWWGLGEIDMFAELIERDEHWRDVLFEPGRWQIGPMALGMLVEAVRRGWQVGFDGQLTLERNGVRLDTHLTESWDPEAGEWHDGHNHWARLYATIGPFPDTPETDRALADFGMHGPFEHVGMQRWGADATLRIGFRIAQDLEGLFMDLDNIPGALQYVADELWANQRGRG